MKKVKSFIVFILVFILVFSLCSCQKGESDDRGEDTTEKRDADTTEAAVGKDEDAEKDEVSDGEDAANYSVVYESAYSDHTVEPIYDVIYNDMKTIGVSYLYNADKSIKQLIDYEGNVRATFSADDNYDFCGICGTITNHYSYVDPETFEIKEKHTGHGGSSDRLYFNSASGEVFSYDYGYYEAVTDVDYSVVELAKQREATEEERDFSGSEYGYDFTGKYGIYVECELAVPCLYDDFVKYANGVCALEKDGKWGYFDSEGKQILDFEYEPGETCRTDYEGNTVYYPYQASFGYIAVCNNGAWAYCTKSGEFITDFEFEEARPVFNDLAWVKQEGVWKIIRIEKGGEKFAEVDATMTLMKRCSKSKGYTEVNYLRQKRTVYLAEGYLYEVEYTYSDVGGTHTQKYTVVVVSENTMYWYND